MAPKRSKKRNPKGGPAFKKAKQGCVAESVENSSLKGHAAEHPGTKKEDHESEPGLENGKDSDTESVPDPFQQLLSQRILEIMNQEDSDSDYEDSRARAKKELLSQLKAGRRTMPIADRRAIYAKLSPGALVRSIKSWKDCVAATPTMESVEELKEWCQTEIFLPTAWYFLEGYLWPQQASENAKPRVRGAGFSTIVAIIAAKVRRKSRVLTEDEVDQSTWDVDMWNASALKRIFDKDVADAEGLWGWEHESNERRYAVLYALWSLFIKEFSTSRLPRYIVSGYCSIYHLKRRRSCERSFRI